MKVLIVGGGLGGLMLAACLDRLGIDYHLIEQSAEGDDQGFSLGVWCNSRQMFEALGLGPEFDRLGTRIHTYEIFSSAGKRLRDFRFDPFYDRYGMAYTQVDRRELRQLLVSKTNPLRISYNRTLNHIHQDAHAVDVRFSDGGAGRFDLLVGADGVHSNVRERVVGKSLERFTGWRAWYIWIDKKFCKRGGMTEILGTGKCIGIFDDGEKSLAIFFAVAAPGTVEGPAGRIQMLKTLFANELRHFPEALRGINDADIMATDLAAVRLRRWVRGRVVLIGDAAHAFEPHTGLGASMAMEDGFVLARELALVSDMSRLSHALAHFEQTRKTRVGIAQRLNAQIRTFAFVKSRFARHFGDWLVPRIPEFVFTRLYYKLFDRELSSTGSMPSPRIQGQFVADSL